MKGQERGRGKAEVLLFGKYLVLAAKVITEESFFQSHFT